MTHHRVIADTVRVFFTNNTSTLIHVLDDESIQDRIVDMFETEGYDLAELDGYRIVDQVYADDFGIDGEV